MQFRLSNQAGVDRNGKTCTRAPPKMKRGVEGGRSPPRGGVGGAAPPPFLFFAHLLSNAPSFRLCFKHRVFHPPMAFLRSPFLDGSASPRGIPGYRLLPAILNLCINAVQARTAGRLRCHAACGIPTPAELGGTCGIPTPAELGGSDPPCSLVAPVFRIHTAMRKALCAIPPF